MDVASIPKNLEATRQSVLIDEISSMSTSEEGAPNPELLSAAWVPISHQATNTWFGYWSHVLRPYEDEDPGHLTDKKARAELRGFNYG